MSVQLFTTPVALLILCCTASVAWAQRTDQLSPLKGTPMVGIVTAMSPTEVSINVRGNDQKVSVLDIRRLTFGDDPRELVSARDHIANGQFDNALDQLKKIDASAVTREMVKQDVDFYTALCQAKLALTGGGDKEAARQSLLAFARGASKNFHFIEAAELLGDLSVSLDKYDDAGRYYAFLAKTAKEANWPEFQLRVAVREGRVLEAQGKFAEALEKYNVVTATTVDSPEANREKNFARVGSVVAMAELGKAADGIKILDEIIQKNDEKVEIELFGRAYNAQGRCYQKLDNAKYALLAYLHVDQLFNQHPDVHAESLYYLSKLWPTVNKADKAVAAHTQLTERYAGSSWAKRN